MSKNKFPFFNALVNLRNEAKIILHNKLLSTSRKEEDLLLVFLEEEYQSECLEYPFSPPLFHKDASLWAAKITYTIAQLLLFRQAPEEALANLLPPFPGPQNPATVLSADLCLRFVPQMLNQARAIDAADPLLPLVEQILAQWHYSAIDYPLEEHLLDFSFVTNDDCLYQLYVDRVIHFKNKKRAALPEIQSLVMASLGNHRPVFWE